MAGQNLILIVEDNEDFQNLYGMLAEMAGYAVEPFYDGDAALQRLEREPVPNLLLLDARLPGIGGDKVLMAARSKRSWSGVPIYMITADLRGAKRSATFLAELSHADGVIEKGADSIRMLRELFEKYRK